MSTKKFYKHIETPWGRSQHASRLAPGIYSHSTASHGGIKVYKRLNEQIPPAFRDLHGWYEEDCRAYIPLFFHYDLVQQFSQKSKNAHLLEYLSQFSREDLKRLLIHWQPVESCETFDDVGYIPEELSQYNLSHEQFVNKLEAVRGGVEALQQLRPQKGDVVKFHEPLAFPDRISRALLVFQGNNLFCSLTGDNLWIPKWRQRYYTVLKGYDFKVAKIAALNDEVRQYVQMPRFGTSIPHRIVITKGIAGLSPRKQINVCAAVRDFNAFAEGDDPYKEHNFGSFDVSGHKIFWKIDYYDPTLSWGSEDPSDTSKTVRVLTILLAEEY